MFNLVQFWNKEGTDHDERDNNSPPPSDAFAQHDVIIELSSSNNKKQLSSSDDDDDDKTDQSNSSIFRIDDDDDDDGSMDDIELNNIVEEANAHVQKEQRQCRRKNFIVSLSLIVTVGIMMGVFVARAIYRHRIVTCYFPSTSTSNITNPRNHYLRNWTDLDQQQANDRNESSSLENLVNETTIWMGGRNETMRNETQPSTNISEVIENNLYFQH